MNRKSFPMVVAAPGFSLGVDLDDDEIISIEFIEPRPERIPGHPLAQEAARQLKAYLQDPAATFSLPLRAQGTPFQRRVWAGIASIVSGKTLSYGELAAQLRSGPRAVGNACGANPFPVVVPCHRVLAAGGQLGGFARQRGGFLLEVKRWLLAHERV